MKRTKSPSPKEPPMKTRLLTEQLDVPLAGAQFIKDTWIWKV
jgi:hypothetical protein